MHQLTLYGRAECHLCQDMAAVLDDLKSTLAFYYRVVEIDHDAALVARFGRLIPVLALGDRVICNFFLDLPALEAALAASQART